MDEFETIRRRMDELEKKLAEEEGGPSGFEAYWDRGIHFDTRDGNFTMKLGGRIHIDWAVIDGDRDLDDFVESHGDDLDDDVFFRRARITVMGDLYDRYFYKASYDFAGGDADFRDVYMGMRDLPLNSTLKVGYFREPFSLEAMTQVDGLRFAERSLMQLLTPGRNTGPALSGTALSERIHWAGGFFYYTDTYGDGDGDISATARVTGLLWDHGDDDLFHLGGAYSRRGEEEIRFRAWPETLVPPEFIDTDGFRELSDHLIEVNSANLFGAESAWVLGPFSTQAEYARLDINQQNEPHATVSGFYWHAGYFLTGEHRSYERNRASFGEVIPHSDFMSPDGGLGAFELGLRFSRLDLDDRTFQYGGKMTDYTVGLNWFLNPMVRLTLNYIHSHLHGEGTAHILMLRTALDF